jgi:hypothetical protein
VTKRCYTCKLDKAFDQFALNRRRADGRDTMCKACKKDYKARYYQATKDERNPERAARRRRAKAEARESVYNYLRSHPCVDCGETDIVVLDFDHQRDKRFNIAAMIADGHSWSSILAEIEKCEVVCANDHRRRTARVFGWRRAIPLAA